MDTFLAILINTFIFANSVSIPEGMVVTSPGVWSTFVSSRNFCLMYQARLKKHDHELLAIFTRRSDLSCVESISTKPIAQIELLKMPTVKIKEHKLEIELSSTEQELKKISIPLWGNRTSSERSAFMTDRALDQVKFLTPMSHCHGIECRLCPRGSMWVSTTNGPRRICFDSSLCGQRGQPACYLGQDWGGEKNAGCQDNSKAGWCQKDLTPQCSTETNFLVCE